MSASCSHTRLEFGCPSCISKDRGPEIERIIKSVSPPECEACEVAMRPGESLFVEDKIIVEYRCLLCKDSLDMVWRNGKVEGWET